jgi:uncharacterized protein YjbI with pentapeptide repeats
MAESSTRRRKLMRWAGWTGAVCLGLALVVAAMWPAAVLLGARDAHAVAPAIRGVQTRLAIEAVRGQFIQLGGGLLAFGAFWYTIRNFTLARKQTELNRQTLALGEQGQVTDRYARAIEQLGSDSVDVCIGGIYALERITVDSRRDRSTVMEVLAAFVRRRAHSVSAPDSSSQQEAALLERADVSVPADVAAAMTVIARRVIEADDRIIDLHGVDLSGVRLVPARLQNVDLSFARLRDADLPRAELAGTVLVQADLADAQLAGADLSGAHLDRADLTGAVLTGATLTGARLPGATLHHARLDRIQAGRGDFSGASLQNASLSGADLAHGDFTGAILTGADFTGATLASAQLADSNLLDAKLAGADLTGVPLSALRLVDVNLTGAKVSSDARLPNGWKIGEDGRLLRDAVPPRPRLPT